MILAYFYCQSRKDTRLKSDAESTLHSECESLLLTATICHKRKKAYTKLLQRIQCVASELICINLVSAAASSLSLSRDRFPCHLVSHVFGSPVESLLSDVVVCTDSLTNTHTHLGVIVFCCDTSLLEQSEYVDSVREACKSSTSSSPHRSPQSQLIFG